MSLYDYLEKKDSFNDKYENFLKLKEEFIKEGLPPNIAIYKALYILTPQKLEKIKLTTKNDEGLRYGLTFYFDDIEELKLIAKYFPYNPNTKQVKDAKLLLELLKLMEELK